MTALAVLTATAGCTDRGAEDGDLEAGGSRSVEGQRSPATDFNGPAGDPGSVADTLVDAAGELHVLQTPVHGIVSLVPSATEVLVALEAVDHLVGRTDFDTARALVHLTSVGGGLNPSLEMVVSLEPELVIRFAGPTDVATPRSLSQLGIAHFAVQPETLEDVRGMIFDLGTLVGRDDGSRRLVSGIDRALSRIREVVAGHPRVRAAFVVGADPPVVAGASTFIGELLEIAGGENAFADLTQPWATVSPEALASREIDVILVSAGAVLDPRVTRGATVRTLSPAVLFPGPSLEKAALEIARALHPDLFP